MSSELQLNDSTFMNAEQMIDKFDAESLWPEAGSVMLETHSNGASATGASDLSISSGMLDHLGYPVRTTCDYLGYIHKIVLMLLAYISTPPLVPCASVVGQSPQYSFSNYNHNRNDSITSSRPSTRTSISPALGDRCPCNSVAISILEALEVESHRVCLQNVARILQIKKRALSQYPKILDCDRCRLSSSLIMLLIVIGQRLVASYQALIDILAKRFSEVQQRTEAAQAASLTSTGHNNSLGGNEPIGPARNILLHDYEVDASEEPCVYGSLAGMQLESMQAIVERMMSLVRDWQWVAHEQMLKKLEEDVQRLARVCKAGTS